MAASAIQYAQGLGDCLKAVDLSTATLYVGLLTGAYTPNQDTDHYWSDVSSHEASGTGYTAGGKAVTGAVLAYDAATNTWSLSFDPVEWDASTFTARYAVLYVHTGTAGTSTLLSLLDAGANQSSSDGTQTVNGDGGWKLTWSVS
jgi:hypothetical protein